MSKPEFADVERFDIDAYRRLLKIQVAADELFCCQPAIGRDARRNMFEGYLFWLPVDEETLEILLERIKHLIVSR